MKSHPKFKENAILLSWLSRFVDSETSHLVCLIQDSGSSEEFSDQFFFTSMKKFENLDWDTPLSSVLCHREFVEFPSINIMEESFSDQFLSSDKVSNFKVSARPSIPERRVASKAQPTIDNMLGGYGSESEPENSNPLLGLNYNSESESEGDASDGLEEMQEIDMSETEVHFDTERALNAGDSVLLADSDTAEMLTDDEDDL